MRKSISVTESTYAKVEDMRAVLAELSGRSVARSDVVDRALDCLADANGRGAWLSPAEAGPVYDDRHKREIVSVLGQFIARTMPGVALKGVAFDPVNQICTVELDGVDTPITVVAMGLGIQ